MVKSKGYARQIVVYFIRFLLILAFLGAIITGRDLVLAISILVGAYITGIDTVLTKLVERFLR